MGFLCSILDQLSFEPPNEKLDFLRSNVAPKHLGDNQPPIYQTVLTAVDRIGVDFDLLSDLSGCLALLGGINSLTFLLIGNKSGVISMVVLARTGKATSRGGSLMA